MLLAFQRSLNLSSMLLVKELSEARNHCLNSIKKTVLIVVVVLGLTQMTIVPLSSFARMVLKLLPRSPQLGK